MGVIRGFFRLEEIQKALSQKATSLNADIRVVDGAGAESLPTPRRTTAPTIVLNGSQAPWKPEDAASQAINAPPGPNGAGFLTKGDRSWALPTRTAAHSTRERAFIVSPDSSGASWSRSRKSGRFRS